MAKQVKEGSKPTSAIEMSTFEGRVRKLTRRQKKRVTKKAVQQRAIPGSFKLTSQVFQILKTHWKPLGGIVLVYLILNIVFASGISSISNTVTGIRDNFQATGGGHFWDAISGFGSLVGSAGASSSQTASILQSLLVIIVSLVIIWALRQLLAGNSIGVKEAYYHGLTPLIPFILIIAVIFIQLLPATLGTAVIGAILSTIFNSGSALTFLFVVIFSALAGWSLYMITCSIFALYIVTLPDMQPRQALRSATNLVKFRRWQLMRRLIYLPIFILAGMAALVVPLILFIPALVAPVFYLLSMVTILFIHTYLYSMYRSLLE